MFTASLDKNAKKPLYEQLYEHIREQIAGGCVREGEKLPSKRKLAAHLQISLNTVENAYAQLFAEGYIESAAKKGYYARRGEAADLPAVRAGSAVPVSAPSSAAKCLYDMKTNAVATDSFPFSVWTKLMRQSLREEKDSLLDPCPPQGDLALRREIARYLADFRGMTVSPEQIVLGAGTEYLLGLITELLRGREFAVEDPCYNKQTRILRSRRVTYHNIPMDTDGISVGQLEKTDASVVIITPSRHFPLGTVMSASRRAGLLRWAAEGGERYLIEDDFDSEFRYQLKQIPAIYSMDSRGRVIYMNTFARTLTPSLRIGYMALPPELLLRYRERLGFYSCTVSAFEQSALRRFLGEGYYERHLYRMKQVYRNRRDAFLRALDPRSAGLAVAGGEGGLHLLISSRGGLTENQLVKRAWDAGVKVYGLSRYYAAATRETNTVVAGYGGLSAEELEKAAALLRTAWG